MGILECPHAVNTQFSGVLRGTISASLPSSYAILLVIENASQNILGCARAFVGSAQPIPNSLTGDFLASNLI